MEGRVFENFQKNQKNFKNTNMPKIVPKSVQTCFEDVLGWFFRKKFLPSVPWRVECSKIFQKIKKISKFQKCPKSFPKVSKRVLKMFQGVFFEKIFCPVFHGGSSHRKVSKKSKFFQNSENAQNRSQKCPNVFWRCFRVIFLKFFSPVFHGGSSLRKFPKKSKKFQNSKNAQNRPQKCPNEIFQNQKKFQNSKKAQNRSQKYPNKFWTCFEVIFSKKKILPVFHGGSSLQKFSK